MLQMLEVQVHLAPILTPHLVEVMVAQVVNIQAVAVEPVHLVEETAGMAVQEQ